MRSFSSSLRLGVGLAAIGALGFGPLATTASADPAGGAYGQPSGGYGQAQAPYGQPADDSGQEDGGPGQGPVGDGSPQDGGYGQRPVGDGSPQAGGYGQSGGGPVDGNDHSAGGYPPNGGYPSNGGYPPNGGYAPSPYGSDAPGVARIDSLQGNVDVQRADSGDTVAAAVNAPLDAGDYLSTGPGSRAELELAGRAALRVAQNTQVRFTSIDDADTAAQVAQGRVVLRLFHGSVDHPEIDTPGATIRPDATGTYWVNVDADGDTIVGVRSGSASVASNGGTRRLAAGDAVAISSVGALGDVGNVALAPDEGFDAYNSELDRAERGDRSYAYLDDRIVGGADLDQYGSWSDVGGYGEAWQPYQEAGWSPYADGRWSWEPYYGWTWVGAEPWGWAPYHYGRWFYRDASWYWTPQLAYARPVYSPALVGFFSFGDGFGGGLGIGVGFGNVGWVPLAPGEAFHPWWGPAFGGYGGGGYANRFGGGGYANGYAGGGYANGSGGGYANGSGGGYGERRSFGTTTTIVNRTTVTNGNVTRVANYRNASAPGGIVAMRATAFGQGEVRSARVAVSTAQLRDAGIAPLRGVVPVVPNARSLAFADRAPAGPRVATSRFAAVRGRVTSPVATHTFAEQRAAVENATRRDYAASAVRPAGTTDRFAQPGTVRPETVRPATLEGAGSRAGYAGQSATQPGYANAYGTRPSSVNPYGSRPGYANPSGPISSSENAYGARSESASVYGTTNAYGSRPGYASPSASRTSSESAYGARPNSANAYGARPGYASPGGSRPSYARPDEPGDRRLPLDGTATPGRDDAPGRTGAAQPEMYQRTGSGTSGAWQRFDGGGRVRQIDGGGIRQSAPAPQQNPGGGLPGPSTTFGGANGNGPVTRPAPVSVPPVTSGRQGGVESPATIERTSPVDRGYRSPAAPSGLQSHPAGTYRAPHATAGRPAGSAPQHASQGSNAPPH